MRVEIYSKRREKDGEERQFNDEEDVWKRSEIILLPKVVGAIHHT